jgi:hypothetical protein
MSPVRIQNLIGGDRFLRRYIFSPLLSAWGLDASRAGRRCRCAGTSGLLARLRHGAGSGFARRRGAGSSNARTAAACLSVCDRGARDEYGRSDYKNTFTHCWNFSVIVTSHEINGLANGAFHGGADASFSVGLNWTRSQKAEAPTLRSGLRVRPRPEGANPLNAPGAIGSVTTKAPAGGSCRGQAHWGTFRLTANRIAHAA